VQKEKTIVFIGNIKKHKGLNILLTAYLLARNEGLTHSLVIAGTEEKFRTKDKELLTKFEALKDKGVEFSNKLTNEKLVELLATSALLVQPSLYEGFGLPPLEAMFCGTKALISDIPVFREIYADFPVRFFKSGDAVDLKEKLLELLRDKEPETITLSDELKERYTFQKTSAIICSQIGLK
jgi:glycosyltransferase involved in cell wall biosynthesis